MNSDHGIDNRSDRGPSEEVTACAREAEEAIGRLARLTVDRPSMTPAEVDVVLAHLADTVAALPQVAAQLGDILEHTKHDYLLRMDSMTGTHDPAIATDTARLHLDAAREPAVDLYRRLDAAHNQTAHISAEPLDEIPDAGRSAPLDVRRRHPETPPQPGGNGHRSGPTR